MTDVVARPRGGGKTEAAIEWLAAHPARRVLVCMSAQAAAVALRQARVAGFIGLAEKNFISAKTHRPLAGVRDVEYGVDNADLILAEMLGLPNQTVAMLTVTKEN